MFWSDREDTNSAPTVSDDIVDLSFGLRGLEIPSDYAYSLATALQHIAPWLVDAPIGAHLYLVAEAGNGWIREDEVRENMYLPKRARLNLRAPKRYIELGRGLIGNKIRLQEHIISIGNLEVKKLSPIRTQYARHVVSANADEEQFLEQLTRDLSSLDVRCKKIVCGKSRRIRTPDGAIETRSVMLADLSHEGTVVVQQQGIGPHRLLGCGIFVPHKSV